MKKKTLGLCALAMLSLAHNTRANEMTAVRDNTTVTNHALKAAIYKSNRPALKNRLFTSKAVEAEIARIKQLLTNPKLAWMFEASPIPLSTPATYTPCGFATRAHKYGLTYNWHTKTRN